MVLGYFTSSTTSLKTSWNQRWWNEILFLEKLSLGPSFNPSLCSDLRWQSDFPFCLPICFPLFSLSLSFPLTPSVCPCSVVRQTGERSDRVDGVHHPTGSRGTSTCRQRHRQTGRSSIRTLHRNQLAKSWYPEYINFQVNLRNKDMDPRSWHDELYENPQFPNYRKIFFAISLVYRPNLCKCRCGRQNLPISKKRYLWRSSWWVSL